MLGSETPFYSQLLSQFQAQSAPDALHSWREKGWQRFSQMGLPDRKMGAFQYVPLSRFYADRLPLLSQPEIDLEEVQRSIYPEARHSYFVFIDGTLRLDLSDLTALPSSVVLLPLAEAMRTYGNLLNLRLSTYVKEEKDPFAVLNLALHGQGAFLFVPPGTELKTPIQCLQICTGNAIASTRLHLFLGAQARIKWIESVSASHFCNPLIDLNLEEGSAFHAVQILRPEETSWYFGSLRATVKKDAQLRIVSMTTGGKTVRQDFRVALAGPGASAELNGIAMLEASAQSHVHVHMEHQAPHTTSSQLFKGVLGETSQSSFEGKIYVHPEAQKTQAYQLNNHLILGDHALAHAKPNLEIFADDVKASHGATVAQIDPVQLFYLSTRGIDPALAKNLLVSAFCQEILTKISHLSIAQEMQMLLNDYLKFTEKGASEQKFGI